MKLYRTLADRLLAEHPEDAARAMETLAEEEILPLLSAVPSAVAAATLHRMAPQRAAAALGAMAIERAEEILGDLGLDAAARILRRLTVDQRQAVLDAAEGGWVRSLHSLLRFPDGSAGALMDPAVLALPGDLSVQEALHHLREHPENVRYNIYVIDREQLLIGVLNLRELLLSRAKDVLSAVASPLVLSIPARAGSQTILDHPAWQDARSVPVVDERGAYLGAIRYQTLRGLEQQFRERAEGHAAPTIDALGDLFTTGMGGVVAALTATIAQPLPRKGAL